jgi:hypothetical protein
MTDEANIYLRMPADRVRSDALYGVSLAAAAWRTRDPEGAAKVLGRIIEPGHEHELVRLPPTPPTTAKPIRRKARKKPTRAKASAKVSRQRPGTSKRKPGSKTGRIKHRD